MDMPPMTFEEVQMFYERPAQVQSADADDSASNTDTPTIRNDAWKARNEALIETALSIGVKTGLAWQIYNIRQAIAKRERELDTIYDFSYLMINDKVIPPVIMEARDLYHQDGDYALRLSGAFYSIESQARFASTPPHWRNYLTMPNSPGIDHNMLATMLRPRTDDEIRLYQATLADGWKQGVEQGNLMLKYGFDRMNRDYTGMIRFHTFVLEGKITMPALASESIEIMQSGQSLSVDETLFRITTLPEFDSNTAAWKGLVTDSMATSSPIQAMPIKQKGK